MEQVSVLGFRMSIIVSLGFQTQEAWGKVGQLISAEHSMPAKATITQQSSQDARPGQEVDSVLQGLVGTGDVGDEGHLHSDGE